MHSKESGIFGKVIIYRDEDIIGGCFRVNLAFFAKQSNTVTKIKMSNAILETGIFGEANKHCDEDISGECF